MVTFSKFFYKGELKIKESYLIEIESTQKSDGDKNVVNLQTIGDFVQMGDKKYIVYKEYVSESSADFVINTLKIVGDKYAVLIKNNLKQTRMIFEKSKRHQCPYHMDFGTLTFGVFTSDIDFSGDELGGSLKLRYTLDMNSSLISANELAIKFRKIK